MSNSLFDTERIVFHNKYVAFFVALENIHIII